MKFFDKDNGGSCTLSASPKKPVSTEWIPLKLIITNAGTQPRVALCPDTIAEYSEVVKAAVKAELPPPFPAVTVFRTPEGKIILADGFHRDEAYKVGKAKEILCDIHEGTVRDAILFSAGANAAHGVRRTRADKQRAVKMLLDDPEWGQWTNTMIAAACGVSEFMVRELRKPTQQPAGPRKTVRAGKEVQMNTAPIGRGGGRAERPSVAKKHTNKGGGGAGMATADHAKSTPAPQAPEKPSKSEEEDKKLLEKLYLAIQGEFGENEAKKFLKAYETGSLENMSVKDMRDFARTSDSRIKKAWPLISELGWKPSRAYAFIDRDISDKSTIGDMINHAIARKGKFEIKIGGFKLTVEKSH